MNKYLEEVASDQREYFEEFMNDMYSLDITLDEVIEILKFVEKDDSHD